MPSTVMVTDATVVAVDVTTGPAGARCEGTLQLTTGRLQQDV